MCVHYLHLPILYKMQIIRNSTNIFLRIVVGMKKALLQNKFISTEAYSNMQVAKCHVHNWEGHTWYHPKFKHNNLLSGWADVVVLCDIWVSKQRFKSTEGWKVAHDLKKSEKGRLDATGCACSKIVRGRRQLPFYSKMRVCARQRARGRSTGP